MLGKSVDNKGQKEIQMLVGGKLRSMTFQATDVRKPLASVRRIVQKGNTVVFDEEESYILNKRTGEKTPISQEHGTYVIHVEYLVPSEVPDASSRARVPRPAR
jgi:hypothetical protein